MATATFRFWSVCEEGLANVSVKFKMINFALHVWNVELIIVIRKYYIRNHLLKMVQEIGVRKNNKKHY